MTRRATTKFQTAAAAALGIVVMGLAGCGDAPPPPGPPPLTPQQQQALAYTHKTFDAFLQSLLGDGHTPAAPCRASAPESVRLTFLDARYARAFTVSVSANQRGALAVWDSITRDAKTRAFGLGYRQGMQLDVNGWRQVRQSVLYARFRSIEPGALSGGPPSFGSQGGVWVIESCLRGEYSLAARDLPYRDQDEDFARTARTIVRLSGSVHTFGEPAGPP
jgi:hypothetical protein